MMDTAAALLYWVIVALWLVVLGTVAAVYYRHPKNMGAARMLLVVIAIDTLRNIVENVYFGVYWGGQFGLFSSAIISPLNNSTYVMVVKALNVVVGCLVLGVLLLRWVPELMRENDRIKARLAEADRESAVLASALDGATSPILVLDALQAHRPVVFANAAYLQRYGKTKGEVLGRSVNVAAHLGDNEKEAVALTQAIAQGIAFKTVVELRKSDEQRTTNEITVQPILDDTGRTVLLTLLCTDITALRGSANDNGHGREDRDRRVGQMAGAIAHDFNNLVTVMLGSLAAARSSLPPRSTESQAVSLGLEAAERSSRLARRLMNYSRNVQTPSELVNVNDVVENLGMLLMRAVADNVRVMLSLTPDRVVADIDVGSFEDALMNLVMNAGQSMPHGGTVKISTSVGHLETDQGAAAPIVILRVADTGVGMSPEVMAHAFDRFFTTKGGGQGAGLGLSAVREFAENAGGSVVLDSAPGVGTTVTLKLPLVGIMQNGTHAGVAAE